MREICFSRFSRNLLQRTYRVVAPDGRFVFNFSSSYSPRVLRDPSTDRRETLPHGRTLAEFYNACPKIGGGALPPKMGAKTCQISVDFIQLPTLIANISGMTQDIQNRKANVSRSIPAAFYEKGPVNFVPLITEIQM